MCPPAERIRNPPRALGARRRGHRRRGRTHSQGGEYAPRNIGAIWIANASGGFVKTLEVWAQRRAGDLTKWGIETFSNRVDAISSATLSSHRQHQVSWDMTNASGAAVPDGDYQIIIELTDHDGSGKWKAVPFTLNGTPQSLTPAADSNFSAMQVTIQ